MFDLSQILELVKLEPGHNLVQSFLLFMIWMSSRGLRREIRKDLSAQQKRIDNHEGRIIVLETKEKK
jgi:hypothetical protein